MNFQAHINLPLLGGGGGGARVSECIYKESK